MGDGTPQSRAGHIYVWLQTAPSRVFFATKSSRDNQFPDIMPEFTWANYKSYFFYLCKKEQSNTGIQSNHRSI